MNCSDVPSGFKGNGAVGSSPTEDGCTDFAGGNTYVRFDVPKPKIKQSWPGIRGVISFTILYVLCQSSLTKKV